MKLRNVLSITVGITLSSLVLFAHSAMITAVGAVRPLDDFSQLTGILGVDNFDTRRDSGITFHDGALSDILPGVTTVTEVCGPLSLPCNSLPIIVAHFDFVGTDGLPKPIFPDPLTGGGVHERNLAVLAGVATFDGVVTQVGLTAGKTGPQFLTAWDRTGAIIGQVTWNTGCGANPDCLNPAGFFGIDTLGVPIAMVAFSNDDLYAGQAFSIAGTTNFSDTWVWAQGQNAADSDGDGISDQRAGKRLKKHSGMIATL